MREWLGRIWRAEPTAWGWAIRAVLYALVAWNVFTWTNEQELMTLFAVDTVLSFVLRQQVTSPQTLLDAGVSKEAVQARAQAVRGARAEARRGVLTVDREDGPEGLVLAERAPALPDPPDPPPAWKDPAVRPRPPRRPKAKKTAAKRRRP